MVAFMDVKKRHKYTEIENKFAKTLQCTYITLITCDIEKENSLFCQHTEPSTPKRGLVKKPLNSKFIK